MRKPIQDLSISCTMQACNLTIFTNGKFKYPQSKEQTMKKILLLLFALLLFPTLVSAGSRTLGSVLQSSPEITILKGESGEFRMVFFNLDKEPVYLKIDTQGAPKSWEIYTFSPKKYGRYIRLDPVKPVSNPKPSPYSTWVYFNESYVVEGTPVSLRIYVPEYASGGVFRLKVSAFTLPVSKGKIEGIKQFLSLGREFEFTVIIPGSPSRSIFESQNQSQSNKSFFNQTYLSKTSRQEEKRINVLGNNPVLNLTNKKIPHNKSIETLNINNYLTGLATGKPESVTPTFLLLIFSFLGGYLMYRRA